MLKIRFSRVGKKHIPQYRIVVSEHTNPVQGKFNQIVGNYNPQTKQLNLDKELVLQWLNKGAVPTNSVARLLLNEKIQHKSIVFKKLNKKSKQKNDIKEASKPKIEEANSEKAQEDPNNIVIEENNQNESEIKKE